MRLDKLTIKSQEALSEAQDAASQHGNPEIAPLHLLDALLAQEKGVVGSILQRLGVPLDGVRSQVQQRLAKLPHVSGGAGMAGLGTAAQRVLDGGW
ncbi:MAG TPA: Clp protease N-terminal domain-containing protein, partial [Candidatus Hydrogenedentes bacterium]|nr:Clp protease N-terminal domain-containing protein [Candidatus Hydrogenedentota bacterium]